MNNLISKYEVIDKVVNVMVASLKVDLKCITEENYNNSLTGSTFCLNAIDMTYLLLELEKIYKIKIMPQDILNENFNTVNRIAEVIIKYIQKEVSL